MRDGNQNQNQNQNQIFGNPWRVYQFRGKKYDIPLHTAALLIDGINYDGFNTEQEESTASYKSYLIRFNYQEQKYEIFLNQTLVGSADASDITQAIQNLGRKLELL